MSASRVAVVAAVACALIWSLTAVAIGVAGGLDRSPLESPLFVLGLVAIVAFALVPESAVWVQEEAGLWFSALLAVGLTIGWHSSRPAHTDR